MRKGRTKRRGWDRVYLRVGVGVVRVHGRVSGRWQDRRAQDTRLARAGQHTLLREGEEQLRTWLALTLSKKLAASTHHTNTLARCTRAHAR